MTKGTARAWLQLMRAQTAPATLMLVMVFWLVGGGRLFSLAGLAIAVFAVLSHWWAFGQNSLLDSCRVPRIGEKPYDAQDKSKAHHPLIAGRISLRTAHKVIHFGIMLLAVVGIFIAHLGGGNFGLSMAFFSLFIVSGFCYNCSLDKETIFAFFPISLCWVSFGLWAHFVASGAASGLVVWMALYVFLLEWFENGVEGSIKELGAKEVNMLKTLGAKLGGFMVSPEQGGHLYFFPGLARYYGWIIKLAGLGIGFVILINYSLSAVPIVLYLLLAPSAVYFCNEITKHQRWNRKRMIRNFACQEIISIYLLPCILMPIIGYLEAVVLMVVGLIYFVAANTLLWGTRLAPRV